MAVSDRQFWLKGMLKTVGISAASATAFLTVVSAQPSDIFQTANWYEGAEAIASSGGRSRGGSFGSDSSSSGSSGSSSSSGGYSGGSYSDYSDSSGTSGGVTITGHFILTLILAGMLSTKGGRAYLLQLAKMVAKNAISSSSSSSSHSTYQPLARGTSLSQSRELRNNTVTVTKLQVAMFSEARHIQQTLNRIAEEGDMNSYDGLLKSLQETILALLRAPETWTHCLAETKTLKSKQAASDYFESLSMEERSKFEAETLSNVHGQVTHRDRVPGGEDEIASHIVVTLLVGTAHDSAVIDTPVMSEDELKRALQRLGSMTPDYLMVYEMLWSPQDEADSLTADELLEHYPKMFQIG